MEEKAKKPPPRCKAILLCDQVIHDQIRRKISLINLIEGVALTKFPGRTRPFWIFLRLVDGIGEYQLSAEVRCLRTDAVIVRMPPVTVKFPDKSSIVNAYLSNSGLPIPHEGPYDFVVFANDEEIDRCRFNVVLAKRPPAA